MKLYTPDGEELMNVSAIERDGNALLIKGKIMSHMPMKAHLRPEEARGIFKIANWRTFLFLLTILFRSASSSGDEK